MKRLFKFKYTKLTLLTIFIILAYVTFTNDAIQTQVSQLERYSYIGIFIAGLLFSFGFTTPFAIGFFLNASPENIILAAIIGGVGAMISDLLIFKLIRVNFMDEFYKLKNTKPLKELRKEINNKIKTKIKVYLLFFFAGIIIASPLPDELGVSMLAGLTHIKTHIFVAISFIMNTIGILAIIYLGILL